MEAMSISSTYFLVGAGVMGIAMVNRFVLDKNTHVISANSSNSNAFVQAFVSWKELFKNAALYDTLLLNLTYWITLAGLLVCFWGFCLLFRFFNRNPIYFASSFHGESFAFGTVQIGNLFWRSFGGCSNKQSANCHFG